MRKSKQGACLYGLAAALAAALIFPAFGLAQQNTGDDQGPALTTMAQVNQAEHQAAQTAARHREQLRTAVQAEINAHQQLQIAAQNHDAARQTRVEADHRAAEQHAAALMARAGGVTTAEIAAMRRDGMGWGQIAQSMGIQPGQLGLGHDQGAGPSNRQEMTQATQRNVRTGRSTQHGQADEATLQGPRNRSEGAHQGGRSNVHRGGGMGSRGGSHGGRSMHGGRR